ncbi:MAG: hypothetical protein WDM80_04860 [Limisphaerales bacterium]
MKTMMRKIRAAKIWRERVKIAQDKLPGTSFDPFFERAQIAKDAETKCRPIARQCHEHLGVWLAEIILNREIQVLHDMANALAMLKRHKPKRNYELEVLFLRNGLFYPGWEKNWGKDSSGKLLPGRTPISQKARVTNAMRDIKESLARLDPDFNEDMWEKRRRKIQRYAKEFKIPLDAKAGRPPKKLRQYSRKKA